MPVTPVTVWRDGLLVFVREPHIRVTNVATGEGAPASLDESGFLPSERAYPNGT
jgi:hypothetical protein